jgi:hypothetical protein
VSPFPELSGGSVVIAVHRLRLPSLKPAHMIGSLVLQRLWDVHVRRLQ